MSSKPEGPFPFEVTSQALDETLDRFVDVTFECLESQFLVLPQGPNFTQYEDFKTAYQKLADATSDFHELTVEKVTTVTHDHPLAFVVLRSILGFTSSELADYTSKEYGVAVPQSSARALDKAAREGKSLFKGRTSAVRKRVNAMIAAAVEAITSGPAAQTARGIHRLQKIDTEGGITSVRRLADEGVPYPALLYERFLGRPFASHRDSVSERVGAALEDEIEGQLQDRGVPYYVAGRAEKIPGFDQAPDFLVPSKSDPIAVIEAKLTEDDGTARDKVTRIQHLRSISNRGSGFEVIACIDGRGFAVRREDMRKLILATNGKVFTLATMDKLVENTRLSSLAGSSSSSSVEY